MKRVVVFDGPKMPAADVGHVSVVDLTRPEMDGDGNEIADSFFDDLRLYHGMSRDYDTIRHKNGRGAEAFVEMGVARIVEEGGATKPKAAKEASAAPGDQS